MSSVPSRLPGVALLALLRGNPDFRRLFLASALSLTGDWFTFVALNAFVYHRTGSAGSRLAADDVHPAFADGRTPRILHVTGITCALGDGPYEAVR